MSSFICEVRLGSDLTNVVIVVVTDFLLTVVCDIWTDWMCKSTVSHLLGGSRLKLVFFFDSNGLTFDGLNFI